MFATHYIALWQTTPLSFYVYSRNLAATTLWDRVSSLSTTLCLPATCLPGCPAAMSRVWEWLDIQLWSQRRLLCLDFLQEVILVFGFKLLLFNIRLLFFLSMMMSVIKNMFWHWIFIWLFKLSPLQHQHSLDMILVIVLQVLRDIIWLGQNQ